MTDSAVAPLPASDALTGTEKFYADGFASAAAADVYVTADQIRTFSRAYALGTITADGKLIDDSVTWNNAAVAFTAWKLNVTATAKASGSYLLDIQVSGVSKVKIDPSGNITLPTTIGINNGNGELPLGGTSYGTAPVGVQAAGLVIKSGCGLLFSAGTIGSTLDVQLWRDAPNVYAQRNATAAQKQRVYASWTDASNGAWGEIDLNTANTLVFGSNGNGTGASTLSKLQFNVLATNKLDYGVTTASIWTFAVGADFSGAITSTSTVKTMSTTVAGLPAAGTAGAGARAFVTDANATTYLSTVAGGGANKVPVTSDGTNWLIG